MISSEEPIVVAGPARAETVALPRSVAAAEQQEGRRLVDGDTELLDRHDVHVAARRDTGRDGAQQRDGLGMGRWSSVLQKRSWACVPRERSYYTQGADDLF